MQSERFFLLISTKSRTIAHVRRGEGERSIMSKLHSCRGRELVGYIKKLCVCFHVHRKIAWCDKIIIKLNSIIYLH